VEGERLGNGGVAASEWDGDGERDELFELGFTSNQGLGWTLLEAMFMTPPPPLTGVAGTMWRLGPRSELSSGAFMMMGGCASGMTRRGGEGAFWRGRGSVPQLGDWKDKFSKDCATDMLGEWNWGLAEEAEETPEWLSSLFSEPEGEGEW